jgi:hypothetical protein
MYTGVDSTNKDNNADGKDTGVDDAQPNVLPAAVPLSLVDKCKPEKGGKVKGETASEEG